MADFDEELGRELNPLDSVLARAGVHAMQAMLLIFKPEQFDVLLVVKAKANPDTIIQCTMGDPEEARAFFDHARMLMDSTPTTSDE